MGGGDQESERNVQWSQRDLSGGKGGRYRECQRVEIRMHRVMGRQAPSAFNEDLNGWVCFGFSLVWIYRKRAGL